MSIISTLKLSLNKVQQKSVELVYFLVFLRCSVDRNHCISCSVTCQDGANTECGKTRGEDNRLHGKLRYHGFNDVIIKCNKIFS
jgi:hypothetical protein